MNSINQNQAEHNHESLAGKAAIEKVKELAEKTNTCLFTTAANSTHHIATRPMAVQKIDDKGAFWFLSANDSNHNKEILEKPEVQLYFQGSAHSDFLVLHGKARITTDKKIIDELWSPICKTWFTEGKDDPRITAIKVEPHDGYYWDTKHGNVVSGIKIMIGALIGTTLDDSIEGRIEVK